MGYDSDKNAESCRRAAGYVDSFCCPNGVSPHVNGFVLVSLSTKRSFFIFFRWYVTHWYDSVASFAIACALFRSFSRTKRIFDREINPALTFLFDVR